MRISGNKLQFNRRRRPIIPSFQYDAWAEVFLKAFFPEALWTPRRVPIFTIMTEKLGLNVVFTNRILRTNDIKGLIAFADTEFPIFDEKSGEHIIYTIPEKTVLIDISSGNTGRIRNNLTHEAVHYVFHRQFFIGLKGKGAEDIKQRKHHQISETSDIDFLEIQARAIAPRILMPKKPFFDKTKEIIDRDEYITERGLCLTLAGFFGTSFQSTNIRLKELGFNVREIDYFEFASDTTNRKAGYFQPITTESIEASDALNLFLKDREFNTMISSGRFVYQDRRFRSTVGDETIKFVLTESGTSRNCLFSRQMSNSKVYRLQTERDYERLKQDLQTELQRDASEMETFAIVCRDKLKRKHLTNSSVFAERTGIVNRNIVQQIMSKDDYVPSFNNVIAILIGLDLAHRERERLLRLSGYQLNDTELHRIFGFFLNAHIDIETANWLLEWRGYPPLGERKKNE